MDAAALISLTSAALGPVIGVSPNGGDFAVRFAHESLELLLKQLIGGFGCGRRRRGAAALSGGTIALTAEVAVAAETALTILAARSALCMGSTAVAVEIAAVVLSVEIGAAVGAGMLGPGLQALHGKVDLAGGIHRNDHDLHILPFGQVLTDIADIGIGNLGDMYHAGLVFGKRNKSAKIGDRLDFALKDSSHC